MTPDPERLLATRVLDALLREDYGGFAGRVVDGDGDGPCVTLAGDRRIRLREHGPTGTPGFLADRTVVPGQPLGLGEVLETVRDLADPRDDVPGFAAECRAALAAIRLHGDTRDEVFARLAAASGPSDVRGTPDVPDTWYDTLAARVGHPVYPTAHCRYGLSAAELRRYAPEFHPTFRLRWAAVPAANATTAGRLPSWWPKCADVGLTADLDVTHILLPVHPLTVTRGGPAARGPVILAPCEHLAVTPTLSMRTMAVDAATHIKTPVPTSTLGLRNRRWIEPGTLADGALVQRVLADVLDREPELPVLLADESTYAHAGHPGLGFLLRRLPPETAGAAVVPVAALLAPTPTGRLVIEELTGDIDEFLAHYLDVLFRWNVTLFVRYGIALEAHQQNVSLVVDRRSPEASGTGPGAPARARLLVKDGDGTLIDLDRLATGLGHPPARRPLRADDFADPRLPTDDLELLARVFVTITVHLCAGALAFGLAEHGLLPARRGLRLIRDRLAAALAAHGDADPAAALLRARTLDAPTLPTKAMVTAGTLVDKRRTGCLDINKHYGPPGPNYLARPSRSGV